MPSSLQIADAVADAINALLPTMTNPGTFAKSAPFAVVRIMADVPREATKPMQCSVEPLNRVVSTVNKDACSDDWSKQIIVTFSQQIDTGAGGLQPGDLTHIREQIEFVEELADFMVKSTRLTTAGGETRLEKENSEQQLFDAEKFKQQQFHSELTLTYG